MKIIVMDTETSGLPIYNEPSEGASQPHIVELAALLYEGADLIDRAMVDAQACAEVYFAINA